MLRQTTYRDIRTTIFGETYDVAPRLARRCVDHLPRRPRARRRSDRRRVGCAVYHEYGGHIVDRKCGAGERGWPEVVVGGRDNAISEPAPTVALHWTTLPPLSSTRQILRCGGLVS